MRTPRERTPLSRTAVVGIQVGYCTSGIISKCGVGLLTYQAFCPTPASYRAPATVPMPAATPGHIAWTLATCLDQIEASAAAVKVLFVCHNKALAYRVDKVFERFVASFPSVCPGVEGNIVHDGNAYAMDRFMIRKNGHPQH